MSHNYSLLKLFKLGAVPALMSAVAIRQIVLVHTVGLSPWHGGGYGMFASIDRDERRVVTAQLIDCNHTQDFALQDIVADSPEVLGPEAYTHVSTFPTTAQLRRVGRRLLDSDDQIAEIYAANREQSCRSELQLQPWRLTYDGRAIAYEPLSAPVEVQP
ncbi:MAG: hypothetical protein ACFB2W_15690 [Leptolyngbyaceae cyanobacterium]